MEDYKPDHEHVLDKFPHFESLVTLLKELAIKKKMTWSEVEDYLGPKLTGNPNIGEMDIPKLKEIYESTKRSLESKGHAPNYIVQSFGLYLRDQLSIADTIPAFSEVLASYVSQEKVSDSEFRKILYDKNLSERLEKLYQKMVENKKNSEV